MTSRAGSNSQACEPATLVELLRANALHRPDHRVFTFLLDGDADEVHLSVAELDQQARSIAAALQRLDLAGERALLLYQPSLEYIAAFFGCLYAGVIAVPAYPPNPARLNRSLPRIQSIVSNARARVALTTQGFVALTEQVFEHAPELAALDWLATDQLPAQSAEDWRAPMIEPATIAFLQYTSGSTGTPKGVMLSHGNLLANMQLIKAGFDLTASDTAVSWLPPYHDMGLIGGILEPIYAGVYSVLMSPMAFLQRPLRWLQAISRYGVSVSGGPNFAYDLCARKATPELCAQLDLSSWSLAFSGAEPVRATTIERFVATFAAAGFRREAFYPCYGLAESSLFVSGGLRTAAPIMYTVQSAALENNQVTATNDVQAATTLVGCGHLRDGQQLAIIDPHTLKRCASEQVGEIWVAGPSVAQGYWERPDATTAAFHARLPDADAPFLRTGDLGFVRNGEVFVTGRLKDLIIIDGRNHYPQDIEATVEACHPALRGGASAAFSIDVNGSERLVVVTEVERSFMSTQRRAGADDRAAALEAVQAAIRRAVSEHHDLRVYAVALLKTGYMPKTSSGKIQRHACRAGFLAGTLDLLEE